MTVIDRAFDAVGDAQRRRILLALLEECEQNVRDDRGIEPTSAAFSDGDRERMLTRLHHVHLPKLENEGFVDWNPETDEVTRGPAFEEVRPLLELLRDHDDLLDRWR